MSVVTIFCLGTSSNSFDFANKDYVAGELVSTLARNHSGMEFIDWIILDGPGSGNLQEDEKWVTPGNYGTTKGQLFGSGWEENVKHAVALLQGQYKWKRTEFTEKNLQVFNKLKGNQDIDQNSPLGQLIGSVNTHTHWFKEDTHSTDQKRLITQQDLQAQKIKIFRKNKPVTQVNLIGWSRGGVTCHMLANAMYKVEALRHIPVRIFAVDPVPGLKNFQQHRTTLSKNVKHYISIYAENERSYGFAPTLPDISGAPDVSLENGTLQILPMPGRHGTLVGNASLTGGGGGGSDFTEVGRIVRDLAEFCLSYWGTTFKNNKMLNLTLFDILQLYDKILAQKRRGAFIKMEENVYTIKKGSGGKAGRYVGVGTNWTSTEFNKVDLLKPDPAFVNWHHRAVFVSVYGEPTRMNIKNIVNIINRYPATAKALFS